MMRRALLSFVAACLPLAPAVAQADQPDWAGLSTYRQQDADLAARGSAAHRVVFMGDSITQGWDRDHQTLFADPRRINRGISGQTTGQMLLRFRQDVIALRPETVVLLAGTNDIAGNTGDTDDATIRGNIQSMAELARAAGIRVVLVSILPADHYWWAPKVDPVARIAATNQWLRDYAARGRLAYVDLFTPLLGTKGAIDPRYSRDGVHPNAAGYAVMERAIGPVLAAATGGRQ